MRDVNWTRAALLGIGLLAAMPVARAETQKAPQAPLHFINDEGQVMIVDPPAANWKPQMVAIPLTAPQTAKSGSGK